MNVCYPVDMSENAEIQPLHPGQRVRFETPDPERNWW